MKIFGLAGWSGSGKTTLVRQLIPRLVDRGFTVSTLKHAHHNFDVDKPGKDSYEHRQAGASEVMISSRNRWALMHELRGAPEPRVEDLIEKLSPVDLVLIEGFKKAAHPKLEIHRVELGKPLLCTDDPHIVAVARDRPLEQVTLPQLDLNDVGAIADFIITRCALGDG